MIFTDHTWSAFPAIPTPDQYNGATFPSDLRLPLGAEPQSLDGGTYMAVEVLTLKTQEWDAQPNAAQEQIAAASSKTARPYLARPSAHTS